MKICISALLVLSCFTSLIFASKRRAEDELDNGDGAKRARMSGKALISKSIKASRTHPLFAYEELNFDSSSSYFSDESDSDNDSYSGSDSESKSESETGSWSSENEDNESNESGSGSEENDSGASFEQVPLIINPALYAAAEPHQAGEFEWKPLGISQEIPADRLSPDWIPAQEDPWKEPFISLDGGESYF